MMTSIQPHEIETFFNRYEARFNDALSGSEPDIDETVNSFAECFIEANPTGVVVGKNDKTFRKMIRKGWMFYHDIGIISMEIRSTQITLLNVHHALVKVYWNCSYVRKDKKQGDLSFDVFYLLQKREEAIRIFAYITGDEQQALRDAGLVP